MKPSRDHKQMQKSIERIKKNMSTDERQELMDEAARVEEIRTDKRMYDMDSEMFIQAMSQFLTSIVNGRVSQIGAYNEETMFQADLDTAKSMAAFMVRDMNAYRDSREANYIYKGSTEEGVQ